MASMVICRHFKLLRLSPAQNINPIRSCLSMKMLTCNELRHAAVRQLIRSKHGSGRGRQIPPENLKGKPSQSQKSDQSTRTAAASELGKLGSTEGLEGPVRSTEDDNLFEDQYFGNVNQRQSDATHRAEDFNSAAFNHATPTPAEKIDDLNEFDSQYFENLENRSVTHERMSKPANQPERMLGGHHMFGDIDLKFFDDINSSFVYEDADSIPSSKSEDDMNEFDRQYFGKDDISESGTVTGDYLKEKIFIDTNQTEEDVFRQLRSYHSRQQEHMKSAKEAEDLQKKTATSFKAHEKPVEFQNIPTDEFADHRETHILTSPTIERSILDNLPADLKGKLVADKRWDDEKEELRVGHTNVGDLESSVVSALKAVKKKTKKPKPRKGIELMRFGSEDKDVPVSDVACSGCGANLHCQDNTRPGFVPSSKFHELDLSKPYNNAVCQRCWYLIHHHSALNITVHQDNYADLIKTIRKNRKALVVLMVDLLDFPCSIIKDLKDLLESWRPIVIVGNKLDLLPKDEPKHEKRIKDQLLSTCVEMGACDKERVKHIALISAKSGYGIEDLVSKIHSIRPQQGDVYLLGTANVGKSTLFNRLVKSDLCKSNASMLMGKATISRWPGTTLNLLRFPLLNPTRERMAKRALRLKEEADRAKKEKLTMKAERGGYAIDKEEEEKALLIHDYFRGEVGQTFKRKSKQSERGLPDMADAFNIELKIPTKDDTRKTSSQNVPSDAHYNPKEYETAEWFYDTPGVIYKEQILTQLSSEELVLVVPKRPIIPRSIILRPGQTFFVGGLGRLDYLEGKDSAYFTVCSSHALPVKVMSTEEAESVYQEKTGKSYFMVPEGGKERMASFPELVPTDLTVQGIGRHRSVADILFSSAGWAAVTANDGMDVHLRAYTPGGLGCLLRRPALLPNAISLRGPRRSKNSPFYNINKKNLVRFV